MNRITMREEESSSQNSGWKSSTIIRSATKKVYDLLSSVRLALALLIVILVCCIVGVTIFRGERAWMLIFNTLWFNSVLVLLVINIGFCFFGRIWGRKVTLVSLGMILFHLSFVAILGGIIYNSLYFFRGNIRLTEGETLENGNLENYDYAEYGRFFDLSKLRGEASLVKMHAGYKVDGIDKKAAYEISVGEGKLKRRDIIYLTKHLEYKGFRYYPDKEGYSVLAILYDKRGQEIYGLHIPLQSLKQKGDAYLYTTGTKEGPGSFSFPADPAKPLFDLQIAYVPAVLKEREGDVFFQVWPLLGEGAEQPGQKALAEGKVKVGERFFTDQNYLSVREIRYWAAMNVRYDPGKPIVLASFWVALGGMVITFIGRIVWTDK